MFTLDNMQVLQTQSTKTANHFLGDIAEQEFSSVRNRTKYSYIMNNPLAGVDPSGYQAEEMKEETDTSGNQDLEYLGPSDLGIADVDLPDNYRMFNSPTSGNGAGQSGGVASADGALQSQGPTQVGNFQPKVENPPPIAPNFSTPSLEAPTPPGLDRTRTADSNPGPRNGLGAALRGFGSGIGSVFTGAGRALRFVARRFGFLGAGELADWKLEDRIVAEALNLMATNEAVRNEVADRAIQAAQNIQLDSYNIAKATGRLVTGVLLSPLGALAAIGDGTSAVESGVEQGEEHLTEMIVEGILLGN